MSLWGILGTVAGTAIGGPLGGSIGGALGGALDQSGSANKAADQQKAGTDAALAENRRQYDTTRTDYLNQYNTTRADYAPFREAGTKALGQYAAENDRPLDVSALQMDPGYQFGLTQGQQAIDRKTAAAGGRISGAALKEAAQFGTDYATTGYNSAYSRVKSSRDDRLERLRVLAGLGSTSTGSVAAAGQNATNGTAQAGQNMTNANSGILQTAGNNAGAGSLAQGNIWGNAGNQIAALYGRGSTGSSSWDSGMGTGNNYSYTPTAQTIDTNALQNLDWFK